VVWGAVFAGWGSTAGVGRRAAWGLLGSVTRPSVRQSHLRLWRCDLSRVETLAGAVGSAGFLCESYDYLTAKQGLTTKEGEDASGAYLLWQGEEVARLRHRDHEYDPAWHRDAEHYPQQHAYGKPPQPRPPRFKTPSQSSTNQASNSTAPTPRFLPSSKREDVKSSSKTGSLSRTTIQRFEGRRGFA
jgi:hypothetical protein